ncbi:coenzyme F420-0:L-glutamate ligase [Haloterrigena alkaliphila]|uniref:Coenzyme F420:L-glutamate ligase n=1 Tax=Haloterrigena alkaliphila TaxID=2816475 RepID=A0A8A2VIZ6_9EURY|nr:coenzyme F420-0:L-glutamate ligase [Haloterrigena alkaliphila]QSX00436.1 coenzyme F420-0:L-glutamate ligase [Haloterrigena alkaliphila]
MELDPVTGLPEVRPGDDIAELVAERADLEAGDVLTVASTIVSKAEGRTADLEEYPVSGRAQEIADRIAEIAGEEKDPRFAQAVLDESAELLIDAPFLLAETRFGHICPNAGIDRSNVPDHDILLLPRKPSESAERIRAGLEERGVEDVAVVVTDTCGRPFRHGQTGVAIGWAGMPASRDWRGEADRDGHELGVTVQSVVDELAAAANLVTGEGAGGVPAVAVRDWAFGDHEGSDELFRAVEDDLVREALREWKFDG